jgi:hypothetical protein
MSKPNTSEAIFDALAEMTPGARDFQMDMWRMSSSEQRAMRAVLKEYDLDQERDKAAKAKRDAMAVRDILFEILDRVADIQSAAERGAQATADLKNKFDRRFG